MRRELERYEKLEIKDSLCIPYRYHMACKELDVILRFGYSKSPKPLQSLLLDHTLFAFRLLPQMQTQNAVSAASCLLQSAKSVFPKQKRALATTEFKQAKIVCKRHAKIQTEEDPVHLPQDVLVHLFGFLDMQSLVSAGFVCRSWNAAANDKYLWQFHYATHFGDSGGILRMNGLPAKGKQRSPSSDLCTDSNRDWKFAFREAYLGLPHWRYEFNRGYCYKCKTIVWLSNLKCPNQHATGRSESYPLKPLSPIQISKYIVGEGRITDSSDSDTDGEPDEDPGSKFWRF